MYISYFSLNEPPFSITPDPRFVYLSGRHREALAHLLYGLGAGGGFVLLTGEVGTGKTTVCRYVLEHLPREVDVALILNPRLTAVELMATVCDELRIEYPQGTTSLKVLVDALYRRLLEAHGRGRRTVLIVDEAQNLSIDVLEQVRLLTNLETPKDKLLQIILIGQPELIQLLRRSELRQLAQRVTARYHLTPFSEPETRAYIAHRMKVAGATEQIFDGGAAREAYQRSRGIPRLINVICDRALLGAYGTGRTRVTAAVVRRAAGEVPARPPRRAVPRWPWLAVPAVLLIAIGAALLPRDGGHFPDIANRLRWRRAAVTAEVRPAAPEAAGTPSAPGPLREDAAAAPPAVGPLVAVTEPPGAPGPPGPSDLATILSDPRLPHDRASAFASLYALWNVDYQPGSNGRLACEAGRPVGLECLFKRGTWTVLRRFDMPAVLELRTRAGERRYATVTALGQASATLALGGRQFAFPLSEIEALWDGAFFLVWRAPALSAGAIRPGARGPDVAWLRWRLSEIDGVTADAGDVYDEVLQARVVGFQRSQSLLPDGIVGEETLLRLSAVGRPDVPSLSRGR